MKRNIGRYGVAVVNRVEPAERSIGGNSQAVNGIPVNAPLRLRLLEIIHCTTVGIRFLSDGKRYVGQRTVDDQFGRGVRGARGIRGCCSVLMVHGAPLLNAGNRLR